MAKSHRYTKVFHYTPMLIGEHTHTVDPKRRVSLPAKFRKALGKGVVVTHGLDGSLSIFSFQKWKEMVGKLETLSLGSADSRAFARFMLAGASEVDVDSLGRILIPEYLAAYAGIEKEAVVIGVNDRAEMWEPTKWANYKKVVTGKADELAERLGAIGAL